MKLKSKMKKVRRVLARGFCETLDQRITRMGKEYGRYASGPCGLDGDTGEMVHGLRWELGLVSGRVMVKIKRLGRRMWGEI